MKREHRGSWYLLTGVVIGIAMGLFYAWVISPVRYINAPPYALRQDYKDEYRALVAAAYLYSNDLARAQQRLAKLNDDESAQSVTMKAQQALADGYPDEEVRALGILAMALGQGVTPQAPSATSTTAGTPIPAIDDHTPTPLLGEPTAGLLDTLSAQPVPLSSDQLLIASVIPEATSIANPTITPGTTFVLQERRLVCNAQQPEPLIQVQMVDAAGQPVQGIELSVRWEGGEDSFFTGLKPELGKGYGDFRMAPNEIYSIQPTNGGQLIDDLKAAECTSEGSNVYWGSWFLIFVEP
jgi:hypothetical protein